MAQILQCQTGRKPNFVAACGGWFAVDGDCLVNQVNFAGKADSGYFVGGA